MSLNLLFFVGAVVSGTVLTGLAVAYYKMRRPKKLSLDGFEKAEAKPEHEGVTLPEAADYWPGPEVAPEVSRVTRELQSDHDAVSTFSDAVNALAEPETKSTFLAIMTKLVLEKKE
ncbi:hypothetical protein MUP01_10645 [Candidatus Bathyarchaeota archaeon]|nr:hypothetical protein [Candidatus Bathyarchaeota archaeon]